MSNFSVTIRQLLDSVDQFKSNAEHTEKKDSKLMHLKGDLARFRKSGQLFFIGEVSKLSMDCRFVLHSIHQRPNKYTEVEAFPIPIEEHMEPPTHTQKIEFLRMYLEEYFNHEISFSAEDLEEYDIDAPFYGLQYVWYHKKTSKYSVTA